MGRFQNVFACLVHESRECVMDLVHNLRCLDPDSIVLLYNGGSNPGFLNTPALARGGAVVCPRSRPMSWGRLHEFALDSMRFSIESLNADIVTIVDSDQLAIRAGYSAFLQPHVSADGRIGIFGSAPQKQLAPTAVAPARIWFEEIEFWRPLLRRFPDGESKFLQWSFWPTTVFTAPAARELVRLWDGDSLLRSMVGRSRAWATEEVLLPTLVALLGFDIARSPCVDTYVQYARDYTDPEIDDALSNPSAFWIHPVPRRYDDRIRTAVRRHYHGYRVPDLETEAREEATTRPQLLHPLRILDASRHTEGHLEDAEGDLLIAAALHIARGRDESTCVSMGSGCSRGTMVLASVLRAGSPASRAWLMESSHHDSAALGPESPLDRSPASRLFSEVTAVNIGDQIETGTTQPLSAEWRQPIDLLLIDCPHDLDAVAPDFGYLEPWIAADALVLFHDSANHGTGVVAFANQLLASGAYRRVEVAESLLIVQKASADRPMPRLLQPLEVVAAMRAVPGWLDDAEAALLLGATLHALRLDGRPHAIVEVGSYCGRSTVVLASVVTSLAPDARVWAIDPHDGGVGAADEGIQYHEPTLDRFRTHVSAAGVADAIEVVVQRPYEVDWQRPIALLLIDGLHDLANVSRDFLHFEPWIVEGGLVAFHDYASYYPGVMAFVDSLIARGGYRRVDQAGSLIVLQKWSRQLARVAVTSVGVARSAMAPPASCAPPLVSCIMATRDRASLIPQALEYFRRQDYPNLELIVIDDGRDDVEALMPEDPRIRYTRLPTVSSMAAKHNLACSLAKGEIICHWDDDDWMAPWRVSYQVQDLLSGPGDDIWGLSTLLFYDPAARQAWRYCYPDVGRSWISGATFCYRRSFWGRHPFPELRAGADTTLVWGLPRSSVRAHADHRFYVATVHASNTSPRHVDAPPFERWSPEDVETLLGPDLGFYRRWPLPRHRPRELR